MKTYLIRRNAAFFRLLIVLALLIGPGGCGYKNMPVAPEAVVPLPINDLRYELGAKKVSLYWTYPEETADGDELDEIDSFFLYQAEVPIDSYCETCPVPFGSPIKLPGGNLPKKGDRTGSYTLDALRPDNMYLFKIVSRTGWLAESEDSNMVSFLWQNQPARPRGLAAQATDSRIILHWQPVTGHLDGTPIIAPVSYQVSRSLDGASFQNIGDPLSETSYTDDEVENGIGYSYRVQAVVTENKESVAGAFSRVVQANSVDRTPPQPPTNVKTARTASLIKVYWDKNSEKDLAGYRVYRRLGTETDVKMIGRVMAPYNIYDDKNAPEKGVEVYYSVTAFDRSVPPNESHRSVEATLR